jgi:hypothetical protein
MRSVPALAVAAIGVVALASGCGKQHQGTPPGPPLASSPAASPAPAPSPGDPGAASCQGTSAPKAAQVTITNADNGRTVCVRRGTAVLVFLRGLPPHKWAAIRAFGAALQPHANGHMMLQLGVTGGSFLAVHRGTSVLISTLMACGPTQAPPNADAQSGGGLECGAILGFRATVKVT